MATIVHGDFEWDEAKADSNLAVLGVDFGDAVVAMKDRYPWTSTIWSIPTT